MYSVNLLIDSTQPYMWKIRGWTNNPCCEISFQFVLLTIFHSCALSNLYYDRFERNKRINVISTASFQSSLWPTGKACHYQFKIQATSSLELEPGFTVALEEKLQSIFQVGRANM